MSGKVPQSSALSRRRRNGKSTAIAGAANPPRERLRIATRAPLEIPRRVAERVDELGTLPKRAPCRQLCGRDSNRVAALDWTSRTPNLPAAPCCIQTTPNRGGFAQDSYRDLICRRALVEQRDPVASATGIESTPTRSSCPLTSCLTNCYNWTGHNAPETQFISSLFKTIRNQIRPRMSGTGPFDRVNGRGQCAWDWRLTQLFRFYCVNG